MRTTDNPPETLDTPSSNGERDDESELTFDTDYDLPVVLVVDDEPQILKALRRLLATVDCDVRTASNGSEAIEILDSEVVAVLISDQRMPGLSGVALLNYTMKNHPNTVRIMLTGNGDWETAMEAINLGQVFRFVAKPWDHDQFVRIIEDAIGQNELLHSKKRYEKYIRQQNAQLRELNDDLESRVRDRTQEVTQRNQEIRRLYEELDSSFSSTIRAMLSIMEIGDIHIVGHCRSTAERVRKFGRFLNLDEERLRHLERAALLHWVGLINAPPAMFRKLIDDYDAEEMATWEFHPTLGQQAVARVPALDKAGQIIVNYIRRFDDPIFSADNSGLSEELSEACHMLNICSNFERTRRLEVEVEGLSRGAATECGLARLQAGKGTEFSPKLVDKFCSMMAIESGSFELERQLQLDELEEGMILSRPIETAQGVPVAPRDVVVTPELVDRLERFAESKGLGPVFVRAMARG